MSSRITRRGFLIASAAALPSVARAQTVPASLSTVTAPVSIEVAAQPIRAFDPRDRTHVQFGALRFRSGLVLTSKFHDFGGLSGLRLEPDGAKFVSFSDKGNWFTGRIVYRDGIMTGLADVECAPMLWADGRPLASRGWFDTESLAFDGATAYVGIERVHQIVKFDFGRDGVRALGTLVQVPHAIRKLPSNKGLEALVVPRTGPLAGTLIAISERGLDADGNILAWLINGKTPGAFAVHRTDDYDISDAALLPSGDLLILERKFSWTGGAGIRIRRIPIGSVMPGALVDGPGIFEADLAYEIDNFEGIDVFVTDAGETVLTLVSDDNFSILQRTLLMQFTLVE